MPDLFQVVVSLSLLFDTPTVAGLAEYVSRQQVVSADQADLARILGELEATPDDAVDLLLQEEGD